MPPPDLPHPLDEPHPDLRSGDYVRFCALYREYSGRCRAVVRSILRDPDDAEDVVQDIFMALWADLPRTLNRRLGPTYFMAAARNRALYVLKQRQTAERHRERARIEVRGLSHHTPADLFAELARRGAHTAFHARLATLPEFRRKVALLCFEEG